MRKILTVKELIGLLQERNMEALVYVNASGVPVGLTLPDVCWGGCGDGESKEDAMEVIFDITEHEQD